MLFNLVYKPAEDADKEMEVDTRDGELGEVVLVALKRRIFHWLPRSLCTAPIFKAPPPPSCKDRPLLRFHSDPFGVTGREIICRGS